MTDKEIEVIVKSIFKKMFKADFSAEEKQGFSDWFKENIPKEGLSENTTFTKQFLIDAWNNGYGNGYNKANELHKDMNDYIFTIEVSNKDGSNVRRKNIVVYANNVEVAFDKVQDKVSNAYDVIRGLVGVEKL